MELVSYLGGYTCKCTVLITHHDSLKSSYGFKHYVTEVQKLVLILPLSNSIYSHSG